MQSNNNLKLYTAHIVILIMILFMSACAVRQPTQNPQDRDTTQHPQIKPKHQALITVPPPHIPREPSPEPVVIETVWDAYRLNQQINYATNNIRIQQQLQRYLNEPDYIPLVMGRAEPFLYHILETLQEHQLPSELALLPAIESAYHSNARSRNGAGGLWQLMPVTARELGVKQGWLYDGRDDVIQSTQAALTYLKLLNKRLNGDWLLTLAAYNAGFTTVNNAIKANLRKGLPTDYWSLQLPEETMSYVPRFLAVVSLIEYPDYYHIQLPSIPYTQGFARVTVNKAVSLKKLAVKSAIEPELFSRLNPAFKQGVTPDKGQYELLTPVKRAEQVRQNIATLPLAVLYPEQHTVQRGDTLSHISRQYNVSIAALRQANQLQTSRIRTGSRIIIPRKSRVTAHNPQNLQNLHIVRNGETLWAIARRYQISVSQLAQLNAISTNITLHPGRALIIREG